MSVLSFNNVSKIYGAGPATVYALRDICITIESGQTVALVGASGSGKTTLLNLAAGLDRPSVGRIDLGTHLLTEMSERALALMRRKQVGFLFQSLNLVATLSVSENIRLALELAGVKGDRSRRISQLLELAGLSSKTDEFSDKLSTGQQQRVAALRAVAHRPRLVCMDEPTSCLDSENADRLMRLLCELNRAEGTTMILATHDVRIARQMERIIQLRDGKIVDDKYTDD